MYAVGARICGAGAGGVFGAEEPAEALTRRGASSATCGRGRLSHLWRTKAVLANVEVRCLTGVVDQSLRLLTARTHGATKEGEKEKALGSSWS
jgi:hypothetical protein